MKLAKYLINVPGSKLGTLIGLITGHARLNEHLFKIATLRANRQFILYGKQDIW
jgi:hypothetical protein